MTLQKNSLLCPNCRKLVSRDEPTCPYCGISNPGSLWKSNIWTKGFRNPDQVIKSIIYINVGMYILSLLFFPRGIDMTMGPFSMLAPDGRSLLLLGASGTGPVFEYGRWWSVFSANFLHGSLLHIIFNMIAFKQIAPLIIREYGIYRMVTIYLIGGVIGYVVSIFAGIHFTIGASASVCSLIGSALYYGKRRGGVYGQAVYSQLGGWAITIFLFGFLVPGINNWGHGGGMAGGALLGYLLGFNEQKRETITHKSLSGISALATVASLLWAFASSLFILLFANY